MKIWAVCKDPGGTAGMLPVVDELRARGHDVQLIVNGWAASNVTRDAWIVESDSVSTLISTEGTPDLLLTSTCTTGGTGMWLINWLKGSCPTVALQDIWGGALAAEYWKDERLHPDHVLANDRVGEEILLRAWEEFDPDNVHIVGFPAMDRYRDFHPDVRKLGVEMELGLHSHLPIVLFLGGGTTTGGTFKAVVRALNAVGKKVSLIVRPHPRMRTDFVDEAAAWDEACASFSVGNLVTEGPADIDDAIAVAELVIGDASTALISSSIMRRPGISVLFPKLGAGAYQRAYRGLVSEFPLVELGCVAKAADQRRLTVLLEAYLKYGYDLGLRAAQEAAWSGVGGSAKLAADAIESIA